MRYMHMHMHIHMHMHMHAPCELEGLTIYPPHNFLRGTGRRGTSTARTSRRRGETEQHGDR